MNQPISVQDNSANRQNYQPQKTNRKATRFLLFLQLETNHHAVELLG